MGNLLSASAPSTIYPIDYYLTDFPEFAYDANLGSTRFFKVARARSKEGFLVVKVFAKPDVSVPVELHRDRVAKIKETLKGVPNCLPFHRCILTDKAAYLMRQYVKDNLYDRISTRPFLNSIEKRWIAFQLLQCLNRCHNLKVCHGDIKLENIMVTSWNWVLLTDFASFKPTCLPEDNPADFSYFFDTSRRRTCYIAPERFVKTLTSDSLPSTTTTNPGLPEEEKKEPLVMPPMDVFSLGCALTELFTEGSAPFDFSQLLAYRNGEYSPWKVLEKIDDMNIRELVRSMIEKDESKRLTLAEYLEQQRNKSFPEYFYTFLEEYMISFATVPVMSPDEKVHRLKQDIHKIIDVICGEKHCSSSPKFHNEGLVIIVSLLTSSLRALGHCTAKLNALDVLKTLSVHLSADVILDRMLPYMIYLVNDDDPKVRVGVIQVLTECLSCVKTLPPSDSNIFPEYILPNLAHLAHDSAVIVRMAYAENIVSLAETALRFLEMTQILVLCEGDCANGTDINHTQVSYDHELRTLQELVQQSVTVLLSDPVNAVKQTILERGITRLCIFFGKQKGNDVLLSHMITYLNDKEDRHLRGAFFDAIVGVAAYVGWQCCPILKPLLQQGLSDSEEFVIAKALRCLLDLTELGLLRKQMLYDLVAESIPLLSHPNLWIKQGAVGFACAVARRLNLADVQCRLVPLLTPFLKHEIVQVQLELVLLNAIQDQLPRCVFDYLVKIPCLENFLLSLSERKVLRSIARSGHPPAYRELDGPLATVYRRLLSDGMTEAMEDQILAMQDHLLKIHGKKSTVDQQLSPAYHKGLIDLAAVLVSPKVYSVFLTDVDRNYDKSLKHLQSKKSSKKKSAALESPTVMNEEWQHMFGCAEPKSPPSPKLQSQLSDASSTSSQKLEPAVPDSVPPEAVTADKETASISSLTDGPKVNFCVPCQEELCSLIFKKQEEWSHNKAVHESCEPSFKEEKTTLKHPKTPSGILVAHLHEHKRAVNKVQSIPDSTLFATCSADGTVKVWDCEKMEGRNVANRSRFTYSRLDGPVSCLTVCPNRQSLAAASETGNIHVFRISNESVRSPVETRVLDPQEEGCAVDLAYFDGGVQSVLAYATVYGSIVGWDLRSPGTAWKLESRPQYGLVTSFCVDPSHCWLVLGTSSGKMVCWDLRFQLPITTISHSAGSRIRTLLVYPNHQSAVVASVQGNNEVSVWDIETHARMRTLWASTAPALSETQTSEHSVNCMCWFSEEKDSALLTGGSDMRIRYWNFLQPDCCAVIAGAANDLPNPTINYKTRLIEGTEVLQEHYTRTRQQNTYDPPRRYPDMPPSGHQDSVSGISVVHTSQTFIVSASRDGVVKVWK